MKKNIAIFLTVISWAAAANADDAWLQEIDFHYQIEYPTGEQGVD